MMYMPRGGERLERAFMAFLGYKLRSDVDDFIEFLNSIDSDRLIIKRIYWSLCGEAHVIVWLVSPETRPLYNFRMDVAEEFDDVVESLFWLSIYKASPYVKEEFNVYEKMAGEPLKYLISYPMKKDPEWYLLPFDERRSIMAEHIRIARTHKYSGNVRSYTTYAFGLAGYEFLVVYEVKSLYEWIEIVEELRRARARKWIVMEEPVLVGEIVKE